MHRHKHAQSEKKGRSFEVKAEFKSHFMVSQRLIQMVIPFSFQNNIETNKNLLELPPIEDHLDQLQYYYILKCFSNIHRF